MRTSTTLHVVLLLAPIAVVLGVAGCGYGPISQPYAIESGAEPVTSAIGQNTALPDLMKQMRLAKVNLADQLMANAPQQAVQAASNIILLAREMSTYQPAIAFGTRDDAARFKRLMNDVQDMAVECAKSADGGQMAVADRYYVRLYLKYNEWRRMHMGIPTSRAEPLEIPEVEEIQSAAVAEAGGVTPGGGAAAPAAPLIPAPATPAPGAAETPTVDGKARADKEASDAELRARVARMRTAMLNLTDLLSTGSPHQAAQAAVAVSMQAQNLSQHEHIVPLAVDATDDDRKAAEEEKAAFKRSLVEVQGLAVECARSADAANMNDADGHFIRLFLAYNQWKRFFVTAPVVKVPEEIPIPKLDDGTGGGTAPAPAPGGGGLPAPPGL